MLRKTSTGSKGCAKFSVAKAFIIGTSGSMDNDDCSGLHRFRAVMTCELSCWGVAVGFEVGKSVHEDLQILESIWNAQANAPAETCKGF